jgi:NADH dehydrogenase
VGDELIEAGTVLWTAGVSPQNLAERLDVEKDRKGRIVVEEDCSIPGHPEVFAIGDIAHCKGPDGKPLPGLAPVAMQQARSVANNIVRSLRGERRLPFRYRDRGMMATVGRSRAVVQIGGIRFDGLAAWLTWVAVHVFFLIGFRNRLAVLADWFYSYLTYRRGARLITGRRLDAGPPRQVVEPSEVERDALSKEGEESEGAFPPWDGGSRPPAEPEPPLPP